MVEYPLITILEIDNSENEKYSTTDGETVSNLGYQVESYCQTSRMLDGSTLKPTDATLLLVRKINDVLGGVDYKLKRTGTQPIVPTTFDNSIMRGISRYNGVYDLRTEKIYKK